MNPRYPYGPQIVFTDGTTTPFRHYITPAMDTSQIKSVRASHKICCATHQTGLKTQPFYEISDDAITWTQSGSYVLGSIETGDGEQDGSSFTDISSDIWAKRFVRFGVAAYNDTAASTAKELATALLRLEFRAQ